MLFLLLLGALALTAAVWFGLRYQKTTRKRAVFDRMARRLAEAHPEGQPDGETVALRSPPGPRGLVAVEADGLYLAIDHGPDSGLRRVPWAAIAHVAPTSGGAYVVKVAHVGSVVVPGTLGRAIYNGSIGMASPTVTASAEDAPERDRVGSV